MTETEDTELKYVHELFYTFTDLSINTVQIDISTASEKIDNVDKLKTMAEEIFIEEYGELPVDWTFLRYEIKEYKRGNPKETTIDGIKLRIIDSADELKNDFERILPDLCEQYYIGGKRYYRADAPNGETLAVLESVLFGDPATLDYFLSRLVDKIRDDT